MDTVINVIQSRIDDLFYDNACPFAQAAFVDVQNAFFYSAIQKQRHLYGMFYLFFDDMDSDITEFQAQDGLPSRICKSS